MSEAEVKPKKPGQRLTDAQIAEKLTAHFGNVSHSARQLGVDRQALHRRIAKSAQLQEVVKQARETMVDDAESALHAKVIEGEGWAVCFTLKCLGKDRGYVEKAEQEHSGEVVLRVIYGSDGSAEAGDNQAS